MKLISQILKEEDSYQILFSVRIEDSLPFVELMNEFYPELKINKGLEKNIHNEFYVEVPRGKLPQDLDLEISLTLFSR